MKNSKLIIFTSLSCLILFFTQCKKVAQQNKIVFNTNWEFVRLEEKGINNKIKNQGTGWESQYNVSHVSTNTTLSIDEKVLKNEFSLLNTVNWEPITLPHTPKVEDLTVLKQWQGTCYYKKSFLGDKKWEGKVLYIEFEGAMHLADVWFNGKHILQHAGGYTPFVINVSNDIKIGELNEIIVRLDNRDNALIPPGKPVNKLDFNYYGGIYRDVNFIVKNKIHISNPIFEDKIAGGGVFVKYPKVAKTNAIVSVQTHVINHLDVSSEIVVKQSLLKINGLFKNREFGVEIASIKETTTILAGQTEHIKQQFNVVNPRLWSPNEPYLYLLRTEIIKNGEVLDSEERRIGIRSISFSKENGFKINGKKTRLVGSNRHMEYPYLGNAISDQAQYRDIYHIKESGFNTVRLGHYMQDKSVLDACDELGVLAIEPIPGWQFFNENEQFCNLTFRDIKSMIRRDRNHPSIIMWEVILNEAWPPTWWKDKAYKVAHAEYPGNQFYACGDSYDYYGWDVQYNDWSEGFNRPNKSQKAGFIREYYDYEFGGHLSTTRISRGDGKKALQQNAWNAQWSHNRYRAGYPQTSGDAVWSMYDYNRGCCDNICLSGIADIFRINKFSVPFYKSQMDINQLLPSGLFKPYMFIADYWDNKLDDNKIVVYANVEEVALEVNGKIISKQQCDHGPDSDYGDGKDSWYKGGNTFDSGNVKNLENPPFTFKNINWEKGSIKAIGYINGKPVATHIVFTPMEPSSLSISYFESGKVATVQDVLIVYVKIKDVNGTLCVNDSSRITLKVIDGGKIVGPTTVNAEAGIASFIIKTQDSNQLTLKAIATFAKGQMSLNLKEK